MVVLGRLSVVNCSWDCSLRSLACSIALVRRASSIRYGRHILRSCEYSNHLGDNLTLLLTPFKACMGLRNNQRQNPDRHHLPHHRRLRLGRQSSRQHLVLQPWLHLRHQRSSIRSRPETRNLLQHPTEKTVRSPTRRHHLRHSRPSRRDQLGAQPHSRHLHERRRERLPMPFLPHSLQHKHGLGRSGSPPLLRRRSQIPSSPLVLPPGSHPPCHRLRSPQTLIP